MMRFSKKPPVLARWFSRSPHIFFILGCAFVYLLGQVVFIPQALAVTRGMPGGRVSDPVVRQVDIARPAIVRIITTVDARLTARFASNSAPVTFPRNGGHYSLLLSGSGAFISAHGDILTANHVVNPEHDQSLNDYLYEVAAQDIADYINANYQVTQPFTPNDVIVDLENGLFLSTQAYEKPESEVYLSTAYTGLLNADNVADVAPNYHAVVDQVEAQSSFEEGDVAIIHVGGMDDMPSIVLGDSSQVVEQDNLTIIGFPGNGDLDDSPTNLLTSSINRVYVSAIKTIRQGVPVIQIGGNVEHGDSGGPALDDEGNIVGIVSFGLIDANNPGQTTFLQVSNNARKLIERHGIDTQPGPFEQAWTRAFNDYASSTPGHWHRATQELGDLLRHYKGFLGATAYLNYAQDRAEQEQLPGASFSNSNMVWITAGLVLLALVLLGAMFLIIFRRRNQGISVATANQFPSGAYGVSSPPQTGMPVGYSQIIAGSGPGIHSSPGMGPGMGEYVPANYATTAWYEQPATPLPPVNETPLPTSLSQGSQEMQVVAINETPNPIFLPSTAQAAPLEEASEPSSAIPAFPSSDVQEPSLEEAGEPSSAIPAFPPLGAQEVSLEEASEPLAQILLLPGNQGTINASEGETPPEVKMLTQVGTTQIEEKTRFQPDNPSVSKVFSVPKRPSIISQANGEVVAGWADYSSELHAQIAPCGHPNTADVRFCRICGKPVGA